MLLLVKVSFCQFLGSVSTRLVLVHFLLVIDNESEELSNYEEEKPTSPCVNNSPVLES
jgi:hypothetical protein